MHIRGRMRTTLIDLLGQATDQIRRWAVDDHDSTASHDRLGPQLEGPPLVELVIVQNGLSQPPQPENSLNGAAGCPDCHNSPSIASIP